MRLRTFSHACLAAALFLVPARSAAAPAQSEGLQQSPKLIVYFARGAPDSCGTGCNRWIAAEGAIDSGAAARVRDFLRRIKDDNLPPIYFHSPGGDVDQGLAIGRLLRARHATARIGRTIASGCGDKAQADAACIRIKSGDGDIDARLTSASSMCNSSCGYLFLGATTREVAPDATFGVHSSKVILRYTGHPTRAQRDAAVENNRVRSRREVLSFIIAMGINRELLDLIDTVSFEKSHVLTRQELYRFRIDTRDFVETDWTLDGKAPPIIRKDALARKPDGSFRAMEWRLSCDGRDRARLMFIRDADKTGGATTVAIRAGSGQPPKFDVFPARASGYEMWSAVLKAGELDDVFKSPVLQMGERTASQDGQKSEAFFDIRLSGLEALWRQLSPSCAAGPSSKVIGARAKIITVPDPGIPAAGR